MKDKLRYANLEQVEGIMILKKALIKKKVTSKTTKSRARKEKTYEYAGAYPNAPDDKTVRRFLKYCSRDFTSDSDPNCECSLWKGNVTKSIHNGRSYGNPRFFYESSSVSAKKLSVMWFSRRGDVTKKCTERLCVHPLHLPRDDFTIMEEKSGKAEKDVPLIQGSDSPVVADGNYEHTGELT